MTCEDTRRLLSRYLDQELSPEDTHQLQDHLTHCSPCKRECEQQQRLWSALGTVEPIRAPDLVTVIEARLAERRGWSLLPIPFNLPSLAYASAAVAVVGLSIWLGAWAGATHRAADARVNDQPFAELLSDVPPGMEVAVALERLGE